MVTRLSRRAFFAGAASAGVFMSQSHAAEAERYTAVALQTKCDAVNQDKDQASAHKRMKQAIGRVRGQIAASKAFLEGFNGYPVKLIVLPEYWMTGFPLGESRDEWLDKAVIGFDGEIPELIASLAKTFKVYLCSNHYEGDPAFPDLYFQSNVVYGPTGEALLRYRRMISLYSPSPYDVWDQYLEQYGIDAVFPVIDTPLGKIGTVASEEILYPEIGRMLGLKGAEVILHPTSEVGAPRLTPKDIAKRARAMENMAYLVSANSAGIFGTPVPAASTDLMSKVVDYKGDVLAEAGPGETLNANAVVDLNGLRSARRKTGMSNYLSRLPLEAFRDGYAADRAPSNRTPDGQMIERADAIQQQKAVIDRLIASGVFKK